MTNTDGTEAKKRGRPAGPTGRARDSCSQGHEGEPHDECRDFFKGNIFF